MARAKVRLAFACITGGDSREAAALISAFEKLARSSLGNDLTYLVYAPAYKRACLSGHVAAIRLNEVRTQAYRFGPSSAAICAMAAHGAVDMLREWFSDPVHDDSQESVDTLLRHTQPATARQVLEFALARWPSLFEQAVLSAMQYIIVPGAIETLRWLRERAPGVFAAWKLEYPDNPLTMHAARRGDLESLEWLVELGESARGCEGAAILCDGAAILRWLWERRRLRPVVTRRLVAQAFRYPPSLAVLEWLRAGGFPLRAERNIKWLGPRTPIPVLRWCLRWFPRELARASVRLAVAALSNQGHPGYVSWASRVGLWPFDADLSLRILRARNCHDWYVPDSHRRLERWLIVHAGAVRTHDEWGDPL